jgi:16S rRNA (uracil1498-N3)-methyltransferase
MSGATNYYVDPRAVNGAYLELDETESRHLVKVMRAKTGEIFWAIDGQGNKYRAQIIESNPRKATAKILEHTRMENEPTSKVCLACGICRGAKMDYVVEKGTELGVAEFRFFISKRTHGHGIGEAKFERWNKLARSAAKQSMRTIIPKIHQIVHFEGILSNRNEYDLALIAEIGADSNLGIDGDENRGDSAILLVGPESGLSSEEMERARQAGFKPLGLGPRRLRAETAAVVFVSVVMARLGEL